MIQSPIHWLTDAFWGKITIIIAITWRWTGYNMIFFLSALQNIDPEIYEAAEIDGANVVQNVLFHYGAAVKADYSVYQHHVDQRNTPAV